MAWNLLGFAIILSILKKLIAVWMSCSKVEIVFYIVFAVALREFYYQQNWMK